MRFPLLDPVVQDGDTPVIQLTFRLSDTLVQDGDTPIIKLIWASQTWSGAYLQIPIDDGHCKVESLLQQVETVVYLAQPVNENGPHLARDVCSLQVVGSHKVSPLCQGIKKKGQTTKAAVKIS